MKTNVLHIKNNSKGFLDFVSKLKADKEAKIKELLSTFKSQDEQPK